MPRLLPFDYAVRNLGRSRLRLGLAVFGAALVVFLVTVAAGFVRGMGSSLSAAGTGRNVILLGAGSEESVERSEVDASVPGIAAASVPGIAERLGIPFVSPEIVFATEVRLETLPDEPVFVTLRGVRDAAYLVHSQMRITSGHAPGPDELIVGRLAAARMGIDDALLGEGAVVRLDGRAFTVVGRFEAPGTVLEAELWCDLQDLRVVTQRDRFSCVVVSMQDADGFHDVDLLAKQRLDLELVAMRESDYYDKVFAFYRPVRWMVWLTAMLVGAGALLGGLNTMYAAFASRVRELATLQALGWSRIAILISLVQESLIGAAAGSLLAVVIAMAALDGIAVKISMGAFGLQIDAFVVTLGLAAGLLVGLVGAIPPALRCLGMPVARALRSA